MRDLSHHFNVTMHPRNAQVTYYLHQYLATETIQSRWIAVWIAVAWPKNELLIRLSFATQLLEFENG